MHKRMRFQIRGLAPTMMNNGRMANPMDDYAKEMKRVTCKRKKTDDDYAKMAEIEWHGSLYLDGNGAPCWPGECIEMGFVEAAKKFKLGKQAKAAVFSDGNWPLKYDGPKKVEKLWEDKRFRDVRKCKVQQSAVMRCRPIFNDWELEFDIDFLPDILDPQQVVEIVQTMGRIVGLSAHRPKFGRFEVVKHELVPN